LGHPLKGTFAGAGLTIIGLIGHRVILPGVVSQFATSPAVKAVERPATPWPPGRPAPRGKLQVF